MVDKIQLQKMLDEINHSLEVQKEKLKENNKILKRILKNNKELLESLDR